MPTPEIAVLSLHRHPRLRYVCAEVGRLTGWRFVLTTDPGAARADRFAAVLHYGVPTDGGAYLPAHRFLQGGPPGEESGAGGPGPTVRDRDGRLPLLFADDEGRHDHLAAIFYALSRYEEYDRPEADRHGRFPASASHAYAHDYLDVPVVAHWASRIVDLLRAHHPALPAPGREPVRTEVTVDVDQLWAWHYRGWRGWAAGLRDLAMGHPRRALGRWRSRPEDDPFFRPLVSEETRHLRAAAPLTVFWLLSDGKRRQDPNPYPIPPTQLKLMRELAATQRTGIHPSYDSSEDPTVLARECTRFREIFGRRPEHSRQHFLRFRLPTTYRMLLDQGIGHDHSMGYADAIGWRAGTHRPFRWYDLERERVASLTVHPFAAMDVTLKNYLGLPPGAARKRLLSLRAELADFGGPFVLLWHNSSFAAAYDWGGWSEVLLALTAGGEEGVNPSRTGPSRRDSGLR